MNINWDLVISTFSKGIMLFIVLLVLMTILYIISVTLVSKFKTKSFIFIGVIMWLVSALLSIYVLVISTTGVMLFLRHIGIIS